MTVTQAQLEQRYRDFLLQVNASLPPQMDDATREASLREALKTAFNKDLEELNARHQGAISTEIDKAVVAGGNQQDDPAHLQALEDIRRAIAA